MHQPLSHCFTQSVLNLSTGICLLPGGQIHLLQPIPDWLWHVFCFGLERTKVVSGYSLSSVIKVFHIFFYSPTVIWNQLPEVIKMPLLQLVALNLDFRQNCFDDSFFIYMTFFFYTPHFHIYVCHFMPLIFYCCLMSVLFLCFYILSFTVLCFYHCTLYDMHALCK